MNAHKRISYIKSTARIFGFLMLFPFDVYDPTLIAVKIGISIIILAEILGIIEEFEE